MSDPTNTDDDDNHPTYSFEKLKRRSSIDNLKKNEILIQKMVSHSFEGRETDTKKQTLRDRVYNSLTMSGDTESHHLRTLMMNCRSSQYHRMKNKDKFKVPGDPISDALNFRSPSGFPDKNKYLKSYMNHQDKCQSLWCPNCRKIASKHYEQRVRSRLTERFFPKDEPYQNSDLHHITGVIGLCDVNFDDVDKMIKNDAIIWRRIRRSVEKINPKYCPFIETVYELELVNSVHLNHSVGSDFKKIQIQQLRHHYKTDNPTFLFVHFHSVTNLSKEQIDEVFKDYYFVGDKPLVKHNQRNGLYVQQFRSTQDLDTNIEKVCSYPFKGPHRYKHSFKGSDYRNGEYFEFEELSSLMKIYQKFQKRSWRGMFRTVVHPISEDLRKWKRLFPSDHRIWTDLKSDVFEDFIGIEPTFLVDPDGAIFTEGWNPNNFFQDKGLTINTTERDRKLIDRRYFNHYLYPWIQIYKNVYEDTYADGERTIALEDFYHSKKYLKLKKDQFIDVSYSKWGTRYFKRLDYITENQVDRLQFEKMKETEKWKLINRLETILLSDISTQRSYVKCKILKVRGITMKAYSTMTDEDVQRLITLHINDAIDNLKGVLNLEKFMT